MKNREERPRLRATNSAPRPSDFPLGSVESRAAARAMLNHLAYSQCICFPADEPPDLDLREEIEAAQAVKCQLHGDRFRQLAPQMYRAIKVPVHLDSGWRAWRSPQYVKAIDASFTSDLWPAEKIVEPDGAARFVLKDGREIHRIPAPEKIYDY
jgi:hypothetical protein